MEVVSGILVFTRRAATDNEEFDLKGGSDNPYPRLADEDGSWTNMTALVIRGGRTVLEHAQAIGRQTDVRFEAKTDGTYGVLELAQGVTQKCRDLYIDGVRRRSEHTARPKAVRNTARRTARATSFSPGRACCTFSATVARD